MTIRHTAICTNCLWNAPRHDQHGLVAAAARGLPEARTLMAPPERAAARSLLAIRARRFAPYAWLLATLACSTSLAHEALKLMEILAKRMASEDV